MKIVIYLFRNQFSGENYQQQVRDESNSQISRYRFTLRYRFRLCTVPVSNMYGTYRHLKNLSLRKIDYFGGQHTLWYMSKGCGEGKIIQYYIQMLSGRFGNQDSGHGFGPKWLALGTWNFCIQPCMFQRYGSGSDFALPDPDPYWECGPRSGLI